MKHWVIMTCVVVLMGSALTGYLVPAVERIGDQTTAVMRGEGLSSAPDAKWIRLP